MIKATCPKNPKNHKHFVTVAHVMEECQDEALTHAILVAYTEALKLQKSIILKGVN